MENEADMGPFSGMDAALVDAITRYGRPPVRGEVTVYVLNFSKYEFDALPDNIPDWIALLNDAQAEIPPEFASTAKCILDYESGSYDESDRASLTISYKRPETDDEMVERVNRAIAYIRDRESEKRRQYEALKREFENPTA